MFIYLAQNQDNVSELRNISTHGLYWIVSHVHLPGLESGQYIRGTCLPTDCIGQSLMFIYLAQNQDNVSEKHVYPRTVFDSLSCSFTWLRIMTMYQRNMSTHRLYWIVSHVHLPSLESGYYIRETCLHTDCIGQSLMFICLAQNQDNISEKHIYTRTVLDSLSCSFTWLRIRIIYQRNMSTHGLYWIVSHVYLPGLESG